MSIKGPLLLRSRIEWRSKVLFYFDLEWVDDQRSSSTLIIWNGNGDQRSSSTLITWNSNVDQRSSSTSIWNRMTIKGPLLLWSGMLRWWSKVFFYFDNLELLMSIKGPPLLQSGMLRWWSKVFFYFDNLELLMSIKGPPLLRSRKLRWWSKVLIYFDNLELLMSIKGPPLLRSGMLRWWLKALFYFDNLELLMSIKGPPLLRSGVAMSPTKSQDSELDFNWWVLSGPTIFEMCDFHLLTLDLNFIKKILTFNLWNLEALKFLFQILGLWNLEIFIWNLELKIWNFEP